ncbi:hypothetical protein E2C01_092650 [Portunus trituberculatus]|uniref:Uncharacterized protein n=1 Tax=Portunus trituberculatus TaxID=210409 RepID=A0A5B7JR43_PORTR|nr:hypothetical protein [Portunus trituberculatus]
MLSARLEWTCPTRVTYSLEPGRAGGLDQDAGYLKVSSCHKAKKGKAHKVYENINRKSYFYVS